MNQELALLERVVNEWSKSAYNLSFGKNENAKFFSEKLKEVFADTPLSFTYSEGVWKICK